MTVFLVMLFAYDQIRDAIFAEWDMFLWLFGAVIVVSDAQVSVLLATNSGPYSQSQSGATMHLG